MIITKELAYQLKVLCDTATTDTSRPILTTVHVEAQAERAFFVAADGYRLSAVCLPIETETEESFTLQVDAKMFKKLLGPKVDLTITTLGLNISGMSLPSLDIGLYPDWRAIIPHNVEPRANIAGFTLAFTQDFLSFRIGQKYQVHSDFNDVASSPAVMHWSIYDGNRCGLGHTTHCWTWYSCNRDTGVVHYLHLLMPLHIMNVELFDLANVDAKEAFYARHGQLEELLDGQLESLVEERLVAKIKDVTTSLCSEIWGRPKQKAKEIIDNV